MADDKHRDECEVGDDQGADGTDRQLLTKCPELGMALPKRDHREHGEARRWTSSVVIEPPASRGVTADHVGHAECVQQGDEQHDRHRRLDQPTRG